jgi:hypothetical protein
MVTSAARGWELMSRSSTSVRVSSLCFGMYKTLPLFFVQSIPKIVFRLGLQLQILKKDEFDRKSLDLEVVKYQRLPRDGAFS